MSFTMVLGYPDGLKGEEIPYLARILAICDSFDAITSERTYKDGKTLETAIKELVKYSETQFDPKLAKSFLECFENNKDEFLKISDKKIK